MGEGMYKRRRLTYNKYMNANESIAPLESFIACPFDHESESCDVCEEGMTWPDKLDAIESE